MASMTDMNMKESKENQEWIWKKAWQLPLAKTQLPTHFTMLLCFFMEFDW